MGSPLPTLTEETVTNCNGLKEVIMDQSLVPQEDLPEMRNIVDDGIVW
jgi:hypothetical protein